MGKELNWTGLSWAATQMVRRSNGRRSSSSPPKGRVQQCATVCLQPQMSVYTVRVHFTLPVKEEPLKVDTTRVFIYNLCFICVSNSCAAPTTEDTLPLSSLLPLLGSRSPHCAIPKEPGILPAEQTAQRQKQIQASAASSFIETKDMRCIMLQPSFQNQRERQLKAASVSAERSLVSWLKPSVIAKTPLAPRQSAVARWADQFRDGLQQTHEQEGMPGLSEVSRIQWQSCQHILKPQPLMYICLKTGVMRVAAWGLGTSGPKGRMSGDSPGKRKQGIATSPAGWHLVAVGAWGVSYSRQVKWRKRAWLHGWAAEQWSSDFYTCKNSPVANAQSGRQAYCEPTSANIVSAPAQ